MLVSLVSFGNSLVSVTRSFQIVSKLTGDTLRLLVWLGFLVLGVALPDDELRLRLCSFTMLDVIDMAIFRLAANILVFVLVIILLLAFYFLFVVSNC
mmetsp:Transcript_6110/g.11570  ORF Transcript_6110/g.11570 Transcript_6110/m.11570 type:complete len:97 (-) Transcript_6110:238-528(-)